MLRTKGEAGTGNIVEAVRHARTVQRQIRQLCSMDEAELYGFAKSIQAPLELVKETRRLGRLPVVNFAAGGIATPADAALMMQLGVDGVFVGSGIFKSGDPVARGKAIVAATTHYNNPKARCAGGPGGGGGEGGGQRALTRRCLCPATHLCRFCPRQLSPPLAPRPPSADHRGGVDGPGRRHERNRQHQDVAGGVPRARHVIRRPARGAGPALRRAAAAAAAAAEGAVGGHIPAQPP
jgi:hypothetical protein